jgi:predicted glycoside hydrolase/deacetylase ChbG (UPF0249 family)
VIATLSASTASAASRANTEPRRIWLCADDYGISPGVNAAIRDLAMRGRLNATSVMVAAPSLHRSEAASLAALNTGKQRVAIGLHVTLTGPFHTLTADFKPVREGAFLPLKKVLLHARLNLFRRDVLQEEVESQLRMFTHAFGRTPDFVDGHQHVQLFPQIRDAVLDAVQTMAPDAWVRQCGSIRPFGDRIGDPKGLLLDILSRSFRARAQARGLRTNPAFAGTYDFRDTADFTSLFPRFLDRLPDHSVVMCHPGIVDAELRRLDPLTALREREYAFLVDDSFPKLLAEHGIALT